MIEYTTVRMYGGVEVNPAYIQYILPSEQVHAAGWHWFEPGVTLSTRELPAAVRHHAAG